MDARLLLLGQVLDHMRDRLQEFQQLTGRLYNLEATPAEGATYRLARLDRQQFADIRTAATGSLANTSEKSPEPFYSNSTQSVKRRPLFYRINYLHISPRRAWLVFSDVFAVGLVLVSLAGLLVLKGGKGITGRGAILAGAGILIPIVFMLSAR